MTDHFGTFEHADHATARREHGYCADDVARVLLVTTREHQPSALVRELTDGALNFLDEAVDETGQCRNRRSADGHWTSGPSVDDCWGRSVWGLGSAAASEHEGVALAARVVFERAAQRRSPWSRSTAFAVLGAAALAQREPDHRLALDLLRDAALSMKRGANDPTWPWPESHLTYANAVLPDAMMATGASLDRPDLVERGLVLLHWLIKRESLDGHLSVTPVGGSESKDFAPRFDQQPIEISTLADACARATTLDDSATWPRTIHLAEDWFDGRNDAGVTMWDPHTGGAFDGLGPDAANRNQGAESTLALISTRQQARRNDGAIA